jgi:pyrimidine deaminase RibD-like protein
MNNNTLTATQINYFMREALREGRKALPDCRPNPPVGCVIVKDGEIVSRGYTNPPGQHHAEAMALANYEGDTEGIVLFVTLEPCSFQGRTPSCAIAITNTKAKAVYVCLIDPHPKNQGRGIELLKAAGIEVFTGILAEEGMRDLSAYLITE